MGLALQRSRFQPAYKPKASAPWHRVPSLPSPLCLSAQSRLQPRSVSSSALLPSFSLPFTRSEQLGPQISPAVIAEPWIHLARSLQLSRPQSTQPARTIWALHLIVKAQCVSLVLMG